MAASSNAAEWAVQLRAIQRAFTEREAVLVQTQAAASEKLKQQALLAESLGSEKSALEAQVKELRNETLDLRNVLESLASDHRQALEALNTKLEAENAKMLAEWAHEKTHMTASREDEKVAMQAKWEEEMAHERRRFAEVAAGLSSAIRALRHSVAARAEGAPWQPPFADASRNSWQLPRPENVEQLLLLYDEEFIEAAYRAVFDRAADDTGRSHYLKTLREGAEKEAILVELATSEESRSRRTNFPGLDTLVTASLAQRPTLFQKVVRKVTARKQEAIQRQERRLVNQMRAIEKRTLVQLRTIGEEVRGNTVDSVEAVYFRDLEVRLGDMDHLVRALTTTGRGAAASGGERAGAPYLEPVLRPMTGSGEFDDLSSARVPHADFIRLSAEMSRSARFGLAEDSPEGRRSIGNFMTGTYPEEVVEPDGPTRWMGAEARAFLHVSAAELCVVGAGFFEDRLVDVFVDDQQLATLHFAPGVTVGRCSVAGLVGQDVEFIFRSDATVCPMRKHNHPDHRELGLQIHNIYFS